MFMAKESGYSQRVSFCQEGLRVVKILPRGTGVDQRYRIEV